MLRRLALFPVQRHQRRRPGVIRRRWLPIAWRAVAFSVLAGGIGAVRLARAAESKPDGQPTPQSDRPLWNGKESVADYAQRARINEAGLTLPLQNNVALRLTLIPAGKFTMGSPAAEKDRQANEGPQREVTISQPFYMGVFEVTQEQVLAVPGALRPNLWTGRRKNPQNPATDFDWKAAEDFCSRVSQLTGRPARLPTEAEWEYACRAGSRTRFSYGDDPNYSQLGQHAWYAKNAPNPANLASADPQPVGQKPPNAWGLYDMHGNVWEWCSDFYDGYNPSDTLDPRGPRQFSADGRAFRGMLHVLRGGSIEEGSGTLRSAARHSYPTGQGDIGFRVVVDLAAASSPATKPTQPAATAASPADEQAAGQQFAQQLRAVLMKKTAGQAIANSVGIRLAYIPAGEFTMGSPASELKFKNDETPHRVRLTKPFLMGVTELTQAQWRAVMGKPADSELLDLRNKPRSECDEMPVSWVSWHQAGQFCARLSALEGRRYRLPTEAEWEYACRAGTKTAYNTGDGEEAWAEAAWRDFTTHPVARKKPNTWGLYDMHGNVSEWCQDEYSLYPVGPVTDPLVTEGWSGHVCRGGDNGSEVKCRSAARSHLPDEGYAGLGFRVVMDLSEPAPGPAAVVPLRPEGMPVVSNARAAEVTPAPKPPAEVPPPAPKARPAREPSKPADGTTLLGESDAPVRFFPPAAFQDGFEDGYQANWDVRALNPTGNHGRIEAVDSVAHGGRRAVVTRQECGQGLIGLERNYGTAFQGELSVWFCVPPQPKEGQARRQPGEWPHTCFVVEDDQRQVFSIMESMAEFGRRENEVIYQSRAQAAGKDIARGPEAEHKTDRGWHRLVIRVGPDGAVALVDDEPLSARHPGLTACRRVRLMIGWSCGGLAAWDDFSAVPLGPAASNPDTKAPTGGARQPPR